MKTLTAVATLSVILATPAAAQMFKHEEGATYKVIADCLFNEFGYVEGKHFRKKPGVAGTIQFNEVAIIGDGLSQYRKDIGECWKAPKAPVQKSLPERKPVNTNPDQSRKQVIEARSIR